MLFFLRVTLRLKKLFATMLRVKREKGEGGQGKEDRGRVAGEESRGREQGMCGMGRKVYLVELKLIHV